MAVLHNDEQDDKAEKTSTEISVKDRCTTERQEQQCTLQEREPGISEGELESTQDAGNILGRGKLGIPDTGIPAKEISEEQVRELGDEIKKPVMFPCIGDTLPNEFTDIGHGQQPEDLATRKTHIWKRSSSSNWQIWIFWTTNVDHGSDIIF